MAYLSFANSTAVSTQTNPYKPATPQTNNLQQCDCCIEGGEVGKDKAYLHGTGTGGGRAEKCVLPVPYICMAIFQYATYFPDVTGYKLGHWLGLWEYRMWT